MKWLRKQDKAYVKLGAIGTFMGFMGLLATSLWLCRHIWVWWLLTVSVLAIVGGLVALGIADSESDIQ